mmetsp:Transcript_427/g.664  ORF Transcript_427/g.664 Transcript_427/m.664 type:complete len:230 (-) Transcript_427:44-733(-)
MQGLHPLFRMLILLSPSRQGTERSFDGRSRESFRISTIGSTAHFNIVLTVVVVVHAADHGVRVGKERILRRSLLLGKLVAFHLHPLFAFFPFPLFLFRSLGLLLRVPHQRFFQQLQLVLFLLFIFFFRVRAAFLGLARCTGSGGFFGSEQVCLFAFLARCFVCLGCCFGGAIGGTDVGSFVPFGGFGGRVDFSGGGVFGGGVCCLAFFRGYCFLIWLSWSHLFYFYFIF